jgi:hypothetical protein
MKAFSALKIAFRARTLRFRLREFALQTVHFRLEGPRIDLKQEVAFPNDLAFFEVHTLQVAGNARAHIDCMHGFKAAGELIIVAYLLTDNFGYAHFRRHWSLGLG